MIPRATSSLAARRAVVATALASGGCAWDTPMSTVVPGSDLARTTLGVYAIITVATAVIALVVFSLLGWILLRYRARPGAPAPAQIRGHTALELSWTIAPALVLLVIAIPTIQVIFRTQAAAVPPGALEIVVRGYQWWWEFSYPSLDLVTASEVHVPAGRPVVFRLEGPDVIHSFWVPRLGGKRDVVPGRVNRVTMTPDTPGEHWGQCAEFCGASHANMRFRMIVDAPADFERWVANERSAAREPAGGAAAQGKALFAASACVGCHTVRGVSTGTLGPDLTHFGSRRTLAGGMLPNAPDHLLNWLKDPPAVKPGSKMPALGLTDAQAAALTAYLLSLE